MKIIKEGRKQKGWAKEFKCTGSGNGEGGCEATLLVEQGDIYMTYSFCMGEKDSYYTFKCAACGVQTDIKNYDGPKENIPDKANLNK